MAEATGYPVAELEVSQLKQTHHFILKVWEAKYKVLLFLRLEKQDCNPTCQLNSTQNIHVLSLLANNSMNILNSSNLLDIIVLSFVGHSLKDLAKTFCGCECSESMINFCSWMQFVFICWFFSSYGNAWHSGIDEAHEMLINRECKSSIVRPHPEYINRLARYIPYRTKALENLRQQLFPEPANNHITIFIKP